MFSSRFHWDFRPNRITRALQQKRRDGAEILDLTQSNPTHAGLEYPAEIVGAFHDARMLSYDPLPAGSAEARGAVSAYYQRRGQAVLPERILLTASTSEAYAYLFKLLCNPGDRVLVPRPSYPLFEFLANMESVEVDQYPTTYDGAWSIDPAALSAAVKPRTRAIVLVNPNNPTGSYVKAAEVQELLRFGLPLISDEVFSDYPLAAPPDHVATLVNTAGGLCFSMSGLSKIAGLPQMKLGWIVVSGPEELRRQAVERLEWIADTYLSVSTPVQCAAARLLDAGQVVTTAIRERTARNLALANERLANSAASVLEVEGGWCVPVRMPRVRTEEEWALELLACEDVLVQPGFFYDFESEAFLVLSLLTPEAVFQEGVGRISKMLR